MKALVKILSIFTFLLTIVILPIKAYAVEEPTKIINVVYDDSGSMIFDFDDTQQKVDTWCQAKYSMEVFAAMLGKKDIMNVYVMSDYYNKTASTPRLTLYGTDGSSANVEKVHNLLTDASETPFESVKKAYEDIVKVDADEKWLVILTDGAFNGMTNNDVDEYLSHKDPNVNVMFLGMGPSAASITDSPAQRIFAEKAETSSQILTKITDICTRIFSTDKLTNVSDNQISFDIPMSELTVFAQGESVQIKGLFGPGGKSVGSAEPVEVVYSEVATSRRHEKYDNPIVDKELRGKIVTFTGDFDPGTYTIDISGAETLEVYYKPNVEIMVFLANEDGKEVDYSKGIKQGDYYLDVGFVKTGTMDRVPSSTLLGDVSYDVTMKYNGEDSGIRYYPNQKVTLNEGKYSIHVVADYLRYNTTSSEIGFEAFRDKELELTIDPATNYTIKSNNLFSKDGYVEPDNPIQLDVRLEGEQLTREQWEEIGLPIVSVTDNTKVKRFLWFKLNVLYDIGYNVEKTDEIGVYRITLKFPDKYRGRDYSKTDHIGLKIQHIYGNELWHGECETDVFVKDSRVGRILDFTIFLLILLAILLILFGYTSIKKRLPRRLKRPSINATVKVHGALAPSPIGKLKKKYVYVPYKAEEAIIDLGGICPPLKVKATRSLDMILLNDTEFANNPNIKFDGEPLVVIKKGKTKISIHTGIEVKEGKFLYDCSLTK